MRLGDMITAYQQKFDLDAKDMALEIGISQSTLCRVKGGKSPDATGLAKIILWMTHTREA
jgi:predicted transcriptional regulator